MSTATTHGSSNKTCLACGSSSAPGKKLQICSGCISVNFCNTACQRAAWPQHRPQCTRCRKVDVVASSPLLAAFAHLPRLQTFPKMLAYEVFKREAIGGELHLHLRNRGDLRDPDDFDKSGSRVGPPASNLHFMMQQDGYIEASTVGSLYGFHCAVQQFNAGSSAQPAPARPRSAAPGSSSPAPLGEYVTLCEGSTRITEYGIAVGSTVPDRCLVYHVGQKIAQLQDPNNHVWMYFGTGKSDRLLLDVGSAPYGVGFCLNMVPYLPKGTPESDMLRFTPLLAAPGLALGRREIVRLGLANEEEAAKPADEGARPHGLKRCYLMEHTRIPVSELPVPSDGNPRRALRELLTQVRQAGRSASSPSQSARSRSPSTRSRSRGRDGGRDSISRLAGLVAATALVTREAVAAELGEGGAGEGPAAGGCARSGGRGGGGGVRGRSAAPTAPAAGSGVAPRIPFRDGKLDKHVQRAVEHFECAFRNTKAALEQATYKRYPATPEAVRYLTGV